MSYLGPHWIVDLMENTFLKLLYRRRVYKLLLCRDILELFYVYSAFKNACKQDLCSNLSTNRRPSDALLWIGVVFHAYNTF